MPSSIVQSLSNPDTGFVGNSIAIFFTRRPFPSIKKKEGYELNICT